MVDEDRIFVIRAPMVSRSREANQDSGNRRSPCSRANLMNSSSTRPASGKGSLPISSTIPTEAHRAAAPIVSARARQKTLNLSEPYFMPSMMAVSASPMRPSPTGLMRLVRSPILSRG
ncbi:MAG: hypothetical protein BWY99_00802 [Synergistetes bacterium ADurb.BinA166]|nr:MAG: hypothetical protein BWY99_00802 [Synergistetes bacterium ADurb.BinA166]